MGSSENDSGTTTSRPSSSTVTGRESRVKCCAPIIRGGFVALLFGLSGLVWAESPRVTLGIQSQPPGIWHDGIGSGYNRDTFQAGFSLGAGFGVRVFGSSVAHDLTLASANVGWILSDVVAPGKWYRGNWELIGELFSGAQFHPDTRYVFGLTPLVRYNFATGNRWLPFLNAGAGASATDIGGPDLGGTFQFNIQAGAGTHYFFRKDAALTLQHRWLHISNAAIRDPDHGTNTQMFLAGISWFF